MAMEVQSDMKHKRVCRACLCKEECSELQSIYDFRTTEKGTLSIVEILMNIIPQLLIESADDLPKLICSSCLEKLLAAYNFQQMCLWSDLQIRNLLCEVQTSVETPATQRQVLPIFNGSTADPLENTTPIEEVQIQRFLKLEIDEKDENEDLSGRESHSPPIGRKDKILEGKQSPVSLYSEQGQTQELGISRTTRSRKRTSADKTNTNHIKKCKKTSSSDRVEIDGIECSNVSCPDKDEIIESALELTEHQIAHESKNKPVSCTLCKNGYSTSAHLKRHMKKKHKNAEIVSSNTKKTCACDECGQKFKTSQLLLKHMRNHEDNKADDSSDRQDTLKPYVCEYCNKAFQQSCTLKDHLRTHTGEQPFLCSECGKAFNSSSNMKQHLLRHTGEKRYECPECPKKFPCLSDLASHKAVHKKIKPHICDICGSAFGKPYQLKKHKMYHNDEKPHQCEYCEKRFVCADHMRRHRRTHTGEKPYKCKYCVRAFAQSNDLIKHLRTHLGDNVYKCELCPSGFRLATELREHFANHKNDDEETRQKNLIALMKEDSKLRINLPSCGKSKQVQRNCI